MKVGPVIAAVITGACCYGANAAWAQSPARAQRVFACSLGKKSVSVTAVGAELTYKFGAPGKTEISIVGSIARGNVFHRENRYAGMEHQLRFVSGEYSYIVYNMEGNARAGASALSGLAVMEGAKVVADMQCTRYAEFGVGFDVQSLPQDGEEHSAM